MLQARLGVGKRRMKMLQKTIGVICDSCRVGIDYYMECSKTLALDMFRETGGIIKGNKQFCDRKCFAEYEKNKSKT